MTEKLNEIIDLIKKYDHLYDLKNIDPEYLNEIRKKISEITPFEDRIKKLNRQLEKASYENQAPLLIELRSTMLSMADLFYEINDIKWRALNNLPDENEK